MFNNLTEKELKITEKLMRYALAKGSLALEMVLRTQVVLKQVEIGIESNKGIPNFSNKKEGKSFLLKTELVGDLNGFNHLIFSEEEVEKIQKACLPVSVMTENNPQNRMMRMEFMTEIDNMVAGATTTELANYLELEIYGNVPVLATVNSGELNAYIHKEAIDADTDIHIKGILHAPELNIFAEFIWLFQERFIELIREFSASEKSDKISEI